jgi:hypothetical protein
MKLAETRPLGFQGRGSKIYPRRIPPLFPIFQAGKDDFREDCRKICPASFPQEPAM